MSINKLPPLDITEIIQKEAGLLEDAAHGSSPSPSKKKKKKKKKKVPK